MVTQTSIVRQTEEFLKAIHPDGQPQIIALHDSVPDKHKPKPLGSGWQERAGRLQKQGYGIFTMVNSGHSQKEQDITAINALWVDMDGREPDAAMLAKLPAPSAIVQSKAGKHVYWFLNPGQPLERFSDAQKRLAAALGGDPAVCNLNRLMRLPGFNHLKNPDEPFQVEYVSLKADQRYSIDEVIGSLPESEKPKPESKIRPKAKSVSGSHKLDELAERVRAAAKGHRSDTLNSAAASAAQIQRVDRVKAEIALCDAARAAELPESDILHNFESGWEFGLSELAEKQSQKQAEKPSKGALIKAKIKTLFPGLGIHARSYKLLLDKKEVTFRKLYDQLTDVMDAGKDLAFEKIMAIAEENPYDPMVEYMDSLPAWDGHDHIGDMIAYAFGLAENERCGIHTTFMRKWLIQCVARLYEPGCQADNMIMLIGSQGAGKTSFLRTMGGEGYLDMPPMSAKDEMMAVAKSWIIEYGEAGLAFSLKAIDALKRFISSRELNLRMPYGRDMLTILRRDCLAGTANTKELLSDTTGNRRFWMIGWIDQIDMDMVKSLRDKVWAQARDLYRQGEPWMLSEAESALSELINEEHRSPNPVGERVSAAVDEIEQSKLFDLENQKHAAFTSSEWAEVISGSRSNDRRPYNEIADALQRCGYERKQVKTNGYKSWLWVKDGFSPMRGTPQDKFQFTAAVKGDDSNGQLLGWHRNDPRIVDDAESFGE